MTSLATPISRAEFLRTATQLFAAMVVPDLLIAPRRKARARRSGFPHPDPRPDVTADKVLPRSELGEKKSVIDAYEQARTHPALFDGIYCACRCDKALGHRSLLSCFESTQAIGCMACREQATFVGRLAGDGKTLEEIRAGVDKEYDG
jgi:hypothetical protein